MSIDRTRDTATPPIQQWYRKRANGQDGPWSVEQMQIEAAAGRLTPDDWVKTDTMPDWVAAKSVNGLIFPQKTIEPPPLPATPPPLPPRARSMSVPPALPGRRPAANTPRPRPLIWGYVGAALIVLTVGSIVAVVVLKDRDRVDMASSPPTARSPEPVTRDRLNTQSVHLSQSQLSSARSEQGIPPMTELPQSSQPHLSSTGSPQPSPPSLDLDSMTVPSPPSSPQPATATVPKSLAVGESAVLRGHEGYVWSVAFSQDNRQLLTLSQRGPVILWDVATRTQNWTADVQGDLRAAAFFDNERLIAVQKAGGLVILNARSGEIEDESRFPANGWGKFSPDGRYLALTTVNDSKSRIHTVPSGRVLYEHPTQYATSQRGYVFSRDGTNIYAGINDVYRLVLAANPFPARTSIRQQTIEAMDVSPDGKRLVTGSGRIWVDKLKKDTQGDNCVRVWDIVTGRVVATLRGHDGWLWSVCFHPDGRRVLSGGCGRAEPLDFYGHHPGADTSLRLWDVATERELEKYEGHTAAVLDIKCSPDGRYAATGSADGTVRLWRLPD